SDWSSDVCSSDLGKIFKADDGGDLFKFPGGNSATIRSADYSPNACPGKKIRDDAGFFQGFEHADVSQTTGKTTTQRESNLAGLRHIAPRRQLQGFRLTSENPQRFADTL